MPLGRSSSLSRAAIGVVCKAIEFLINCERTVVVLHLLLRDAQNKKRQDLVTEYTAHLAEMVRVAPFEKTLSNCDDKR